MKRSILRFTGVIFDLDGTLLDTLEDLSNAANRVLARCGFPVHSLDTYRYLVGEGMTMLIKRALPEDKRDEDTISVCVRAYRKEYARSWNVHTKLYDGVAELLNALSVHGIKMAILSNKPDDFTRLCVSAFLSSWKFDMVLGQCDSFPGKPDPSGARLIAESLHIPPEQFIYLGDTAIDMQTAVRANMFPVGALWGFRTEKELLESGARALIKRPQDIVKILD